MARIEEIERRLANWVRWRHARGGGQLGYASVKFGADVGNRAAYREARIPTLDCEASETEDLVQRLPEELRLTVVEYYAEQRSELDCMARWGCGRATLHARIGRAHKALNEMVLERRRVADAERARVEGLSDGVLVVRHFR